mmetsp:Transcript_30806/g.99324  ORF Transcript_30806/g.99324 Transcript_30806/m.99324 type:complete len:411 (+) Transcript_30806:2064-3296(+)
MGHRQHRHRIQRRRPLQEHRRPRTLLMLLLLLLLLLLVVLLLMVRVRVIIIRVVGPRLLVLLLLPPLLLLLLLLLVLQEQMLLLGGGGGGDALGGHHRGGVREEARVLYELLLGDGGARGGDVREFGEFVRGDAGRRRREEGRRGDAPVGGHQLRHGEARRVAVVPRRSRPNVVLGTPPHSAVVRSSSVFGAQPAGRVDVAEEGRRGEGLGAVDEHLLADLAEGPLLGCSDDAARRSGDGVDAVVGVPRALGEEEPFLRGGQSEGGPEARRTRAALARGLGRRAAAAGSRRGRLTRRARRRLVRVLLQELLHGQGPLLRRVGRVHRLRDLLLRRVALGRLAVRGRHLKRRQRRRRRTERQVRLRPSTLLLLLPLALHRRRGRRRNNFFFPRADPFESPPASKRKDLGLPA